MHLRSRHRRRDHADQGRHPGQPVARSSRAPLIPTGANVTSRRTKRFDAVLAEAGVPRERHRLRRRHRLRPLQGRRFGDAQVTEISCHARGAHFMFPGTRTVIDMGGQDTKAIKVGTERRSRRLLP